MTEWTRLYATPGGAALCEAMVKYTLQSGGTSSAEDVRIVMKELNNRLHGVVRSETMSIADMLTQAGLKKGKLEGKLEGRLEGELNKALEIARNMLLKGMPAATVAELTSLSAQRINLLGVNKKPRA